MMSKPQLVYNVSILHTFVFFIICVFFTLIALFWELRQRFVFYKYCKLRTLSNEELKSTINDFNSFIKCSDPYIEHFLNKHPAFTRMSPLWVQNSHRYWIKRYKKELKRRGLQ